jgi:hypothetical protein
MNIGSALLAMSAIWIVGARLVAVLDGLIIARAAERPFAPALSKPL